MIPVIALIVLLAVYDWVSVYVTKHMVTLAKESKGRFNMMFLVPVGDRAMGLGAGDIALPVTFAVSVFSSHGAGYAIATAYGGLSGLVWVFLYIMGKKNVTLPALPPITLGLIAGYSICRLILG
jgi:presenilin-like A22 family membrane protease